MSGGESIHCPPNERRKQTPKKHSLKGTTVNEEQAKDGASQLAEMSSATWHDFLCDGGSGQGRVSRQLPHMYAFASLAGMSDSGAEKRRRDRDSCCMIRTSTGWNVELVFIT